MHPVNVNVTELRSHLQKYLSSAHNGREVLVTLHGEVIARIVPPEDSRGEAIKQLKALQKKCKIGDVVTPVDEDWDVDK